MVHLSRLAEDVILFSTEEFGFFEIARLGRDRIEPDAAEEESRIRSSSCAASPARPIGLLTGWLTTMKGLPLGYNKDLQEDKARRLRGRGHCSIACARTTATVVRTLTLRPDRDARRRVGIAARHRSRRLPRRARRAVPDRARSHRPHRPRSLRRPASDFVALSLADWRRYHELVRRGRVRRRSRPRPRSPRKRTPQSTHPEAVARPWLN